MERFTRRVGKNDYRIEYSKMCDFFTDGGKKVINCLGSYEDTGLTPESVETLKLSMMGKTMSEITEFDGLPIERLKELAKADKEGRVVVLPCKVGDTVWIIPSGEKFWIECDVEFVNIGKLGVTIVLGEKDGLRKQHGVTITAFGKTVFLTREDAEETLRRC